MKSPGLIEKIDDSINPIVVKELRQAVHSKFVVAVVLMFLLLQLVGLGLFLTFTGLGGRLDVIDYQAGRDVFTMLQVMVLATCMLFLPAYTGARLAAERSEVNTDLLFISTLQPRKIISGKLASAVIIAVMIFSACAPFMAFTYFLRGIDLPTIFFVLAIDFLVVIGSVHLMVLLAVIPCNRVLKAFLGVLGFGMLVFIFAMVLGGTLTMVQMGYAPQFDEREFLGICATVLIGFFGNCGLLYTWSIALITAPSSNRALPMRVFMLSYAIVSGVLTAFLVSATRQEEPFWFWSMLMGEFVAFALIIAINERERWTPRVARTIPRNWLLRLPAFLFYSGAAGGVLFALWLAGAVVLILWVSSLALASQGIVILSPTMGDFVYVVGILVAYVYCYGLTAIFVRTWLLRTLASGFTWVVFILLIALGSLIPMLATALLHLGRWNYADHYASFLGNPVAGAIEMTQREHSLQAEDYLRFLAVWGAAATLLCVPWIFRQLRAFRPYDASSAVVLPVTLADSSSATLPVTVR